MKVKQHAIIFMYEHISNNSMLNIARGHNFEIYVIHSSIATACNNISEPHARNSDCEVIVSRCSSSEGIQHNKKAPHQSLI